MAQAIHADQGVGTRTRATARDDCKDKKGEGKVKWYQRRKTAQSSWVRGSINARRRARVQRIASSPCARRKGLCYRNEFIEACWEKAAPKHVGGREVLLKKKGDKVENEVKPKMTWYQPTRHSFVSRHLSRCASLDEVSAAVGHSSPIVTKRVYDHYVRRSFSPKLRAGLGLGANHGGKVVSLKKVGRDA